MSKLLIVALSGIMFVTVGCQNKDDDMDDMNNDRMGSSSRTESRMSAGADDCPHCEGKQKAKADGTCPKCNMKMK